MTRFRMGWNSGPGKGEEVKFAASEYLNRTTGRFVYMSGGFANLRTNATVTSAAQGIFGWAEGPKDDALKNGYKTISGDKLFVISGIEDKFWMPLDTASASANATLIGGYAACKTANATYAITQKASNVVAASANLLIHDFDDVNDAVLVSIKPAAYMV